MDENVIIDISQTQYEIVAVVAVEDMGWEIAEEDDFDLVWMDTGVTPEILS